MASPLPIDSLQTIMDVANSLGLFKPNNPQAGIPGQLQPMGGQDYTWMNPGITPTPQAPKSNDPIATMQMDPAQNPQIAPITPGPEPKEKKKPDYNKIAGIAMGGLSLIDHLIPEQKIKNPVIRPLPVYNPKPDGTGSQAIAKNGVKLENGGDPDPKKPKQPYSFVDEFKKLSKNKLDGTSSFQLAKKAAEQTHINPSLLYSSAYVEGMNKNLVDPRPLQSDAYANAIKGVVTDFSGKKRLGTQNKIDESAYPVDGYATYGLDTFGSRFDEFVKKGYLPEDFKDQFIPYKASNEKEQVTTAAFKSNGSALMAKAAYLRSTQDDVVNYFKKKNQQLDPEAQDFFTMAVYNSTKKSGYGMMDEYMKAKDKKAFLEKGQTKYKSIWDHIHQRSELMPLVDEYMNSDMKNGGKMKGKKCENGMKLMEGQSYDLDAATIKQLLEQGYEIDFE